MDANDGGRSRPSPATAPHRSPRPNVARALPATLGDPARCITGFRSACSFSGGRAPGAVPGLDDGVVRPGRRLRRARPTTPVAPAAHASTISTATLGLRSMTILLWGRAQRVSAPGLSGSRTGLRRLVAECRGELLGCRGGDPVDVPLHLGRERCQSRRARRGGASGDLARLAVADEQRRTEDRSGRHPQLRRRGVGFRLSRFAAADGVETVMDSSCRSGLWPDRSLS